MINLLSLIYPTRCPYCNKFIDLKSFACEACKKKIKFISRPRILNHYQNHSIKCIAPMSYEDDVRKAIWHFKFRNRKEYARLFAIAASSHLKENIKEPFDLITSAPLSQERLKERGYNQSELFAKNVAKNIHLKYKETLIKTKNNKPQHTLAYNERIENIKNIYSCKNANLIHNKKILLCDDIITTGHTICECAKTLIKSGASKVTCLAIAFVDDKY